MNKKKTNGSKQNKSKKREILGIVLIVVSLFLAVALLSHNPGDWPGSSKAFDEPSNNLIGRYGAFVSHYLFQLIGWTAFAVVLFMISAGGVLFLHRSLNLLWEPGFFLAIAGLFIPLLISLTLDIGADNTRVEPAFQYGGVLGGLIAHYMVTYLGRFGTYLVSLGSILIVIVLTTNIRPSNFAELLIAVAKPFVNMAIAGIKALKPEPKPEPEPSRRSMSTPQKDKNTVESAADDTDENPFLTPMEDDAGHEPPTMEPYTAGNEPVIALAKALVEDAGLMDEETEGGEDSIDRAMGSVPEEYVLPGMDLLDEPPEDTPGETKEEMLQQAQRIVESLRHFNIDAEVKQITPGPIVTRYEVTLAPGVKVGRVVNLANDLTMALRARGGIRILAPIPGKAAIGIEVPNRQRQTVYFREVVESEVYKTTDRPLVLAIGKNTSGDPVVADLAKMPHLLIAGSTGSGKSVCINTIICSILMKAAPNDVRMILVDPKVVELNIYNPIPHLLTPVITNPDRAASSLKWAVREMEARYRKLAKQGVRDIYQYNEKVDRLREEYEDSDTGETEPAPDIPERLPLIVIIIDEFADLMAVASNEIEESIARLAQMARAVGMHIVLATQRPSADIITGLIKANFPSRIAFKVMQASNSRIILDESGADKLLGMGDMLFLQAGRPEAVRLHGAFISGDECNRILEFIEEHTTSKPEKISEDEFSTDSVETDNVLGLRDPNDRDSLFYEAARLVVRHNQGSVSLLQRRLKIGYARAARLIDQLELAGVVSPFEGSKAREVLVDDIYIDQLEAGEL